MLSTERKFIKNPTIVYYAGPGNITILNMNHEDTYATSKNPQASLIIAIRDYCQPSDENWRTIDVHNGNYSLPDNPYGVKMNIVVILTNLNLYKEIKINITNHRFINYVESVSQLLYLVGNHAVEVYTSNIYFENVESNIVYAEFKFFRLAMIDQFTFKSISSSENKVAILVQFILAVIITDTVLEDINGTERTSLPLIFLNNFAPSYILISGLKIKNSYMMNRKILNNIASLQTLTITGGEYDEVTQSTGGVLFSTGIIGQLIFTNHTFTNMLSSDRTSKILELTNIDLSYGLNSTIQDISLSNSTSGVFGFNGISNSNTSPLVILINNLKYSDSILKSVKSLIVTKNLVWNGPFTLVFENWTFNNISFENKGYIFDFSHHLTQPIVIQNSNFTNLSAALIKIEANNKEETTLKTMVLIENTPFSEINSRYNSFININEGGILEVNNSTFTNLMTYEEGAVLNAGSQKSISKLTNWVFTENSAEVGAWFYVEAQSLIEILNCSIYNNFAISSPVIYSTNNGYFKIIESSIHHNYALESSVAQLFDSALQSEIINTKIYDNIALTVEEIEKEMSGTCDVLYFLPLLFNSTVLTPIFYSKYVYLKDIIQLISASLLIKGDTEIFSQDKLFNVFLSTINFENTLLRDIELAGEGIQIVSSTLIMKNVIMKNISNPVDTTFIFGFLDSTINIQNSSFKDSTSIFLNLRNSQLNINNFTINNVNSSTSLIKIASSFQVMLGKFSFI